MSLFPMYFPVFFSVFATLAQEERLKRDLGLELFLGTAKLGRKYLKIVGVGVFPTWPVA